MRTSTGPDEDRFIIHGATSIGISNLKHIEIEVTMWIYERQYGYITYQPYQPFWLLIDIEPKFT